MIARTRNALCLVLAAPLCAFGQEGGQSETVAPAPAEVTEEVVVRGQTRAGLRLQIELAEEAVYDRFNEINSRDEFDIHCRDEMITGSRIPRRFCRANFWRNAEAQAGLETTRAFQGSAFTASAAEFQAEALYKHTLLSEEMRRLAGEDEELEQALVRLADLKETMAAHNGKPREFTSARVATAGEAELPYDAALVADVRMRRDAWSHVLTQPTFTITNVYGELGLLELECGGQSQRLRYEPGTEWTVPDGWGSCTLGVEAQPGTTFSLYEFE